MAKLRILVVDDSVVIRKIITDALSADPELEVVTAANGRLAIAKLEQVNPDLVTLDFEMPEMDGLQTLKAIRLVRPKLPVVMFSTLTARGAEVTMNALAAGANDYLTKPANVGSVTESITRVRDEMVPMIKGLCGRRTGPAVTLVPVSPPRADKLPLPAGPVDVVAIGVSTGGPNALSAMMPGLPATLAVPVLIVQHMPPMFTKLLAERLSAQSKIPVHEAAHGMAVQPGNAYIAPGGSHMVVERTAAGQVLKLNQEPPENSCRPAVDVLFRSVAAVYGSRTLAVIMTGMGADGLRGCETIRDRRGQIIVQDEATSIVWGMPGIIAKHGLAQKQLPLTEIAQEISLRTSVGRRNAA